MFWILFAAQLNSASPIDNRLSDVRALFSYEDVPDYLLHGGEVKRTVYTRTTVRNNGSVESCAVEQSSGDAKLDAYTCGIILRRLKAVPAKWLDGSAAYSVLRFPVTYTVTDSTPSKDEMLKAVLPDLELSVSRLPKGAPKVIDVDLEVAADETGRIVSCKGLSPNKKDRRRRFPELASVACQQIGASMVLRPPFDQSGKPMHSVQTVSVRLALAH